MLPCGTRKNLLDLPHVFLVLDVHYADPAQQPLTTAGEKLDYLDRDISDLSDLDNLDHDLFEV